jgi:RES domain-containing protein
VFFRHVPAGGAPLYRPERPADGRWQRGQVVEGFYLASDEQTAWAEWYRALAELAVPPMRQMPRDLWRFEVELEGVADLSDARKLAAVGLPLPEPSRKQWPRFQALGEALAAGGWTGILYPSAARSGSKVALCVFRGAGGLTGIEPLGSPVRYEEPPALPSGLRT